MSAAPSIRPMDSACLLNRQERRAVESRIKHSGLHSTAVRLLMEIAELAGFGRNPRGCFATTTTLLERLGNPVKLRQGGNLLRELEEGGWIIVLRVGNSQSRFARRHILLGPRCLNDPTPAPSNPMTVHLAIPYRAPSNPVPALPPTGDESRKTTTETRESSSPFPPNLPDTSDHSSIDPPSVLPPADAEAVEMLCDRFTRRMKAPPARVMVERWVEDYGRELVEVAAEMIEREKLRKVHAIRTFLGTHRGVGPDWVRADAGLPARPKPAAPPASQSKVPESISPDQEIADLEQALRELRMAAEEEPNKASDASRSFYQKAILRAEAELAAMKPSQEPPGILSISTHVNT